MEVLNVIVELEEKLAFVKSFVVPDLKLKDLALLKALDFKAVEEEKCKHLDGFKATLVWSE